MKRAAPITLRVWNDWYGYKKAYVLQGFTDLEQQGEVKIEWCDYPELERRGAPPPSEGPYHSHHNQVVFQVSTGGSRWWNGVYDCNDVYYKIPNALLRWSDLYFKSNYQPEYLSTGTLLSDPYWDSIPLRENCLPEPLDLAHSGKCRPCSFSMRLSESPRKNRAYFRKLEGTWLQSSPAQKRYDLFYLASYWEKRREIMDTLVEQIERAGARWLGGLVETKGPLPEPLLPYRQETVDQDRWGLMAAEARLPLMERGLDGCTSYKPAHYCLIGAPFLAMSFKTNFWTPLRPSWNYLEVRDDFSDLGEQLLRVSDETLMEMGRRNLAFWQQVLCPEATARYLLREFLHGPEGAS